ncbi:MAG TPA: glycosyltransferase family 2 protein [Acidobacteriota bacterium]|nr:glycosyltransferase family 2 protein [Acidobacteriota bacterium]
MREKLSVLILTHQEEENIAGCITSLGTLPDETVVLDSFSADRTVAIARSLNATVHQRKFDDYPSQRNAGLQLLQHDWVLVIDADERLTDALREEIANLLDSEPVCDGYFIKREAFFNGTRVRCWSGGSVLRLFRRNKARYRPERIVHEELLLDGTKATLKSTLEHHTFRSLDQYLPKMHSYSIMAARQAFQAGERSSLTALLFYPIGRFLKTYLLRGGILDGMRGLILAWLSAYATYLKYAKLWELQKR